MVEWSWDAIASLIESYKSRPALWDPACDGYKNKNTKCEALSEIAEALKTIAPTYDFSNAIITTKWQNLRRTFHTEAKKVAEKYPPSRSGGSTVYKPSLWLVCQINFVPSIYR